ncbi:hypothetical protein [Marinobacterium weihaiense]|uniref:Phage integrase family protein n=1 Tax=Marinobacterium weihaiense TaxID=2851016 RepID=A0ABS6M9L6_9GAMM|nr:hypothetical protein [Marinobacterium weihaiense]MBV0932979.1 hypothetical protein [Marinobacterium weihaiense]
MSAATLDYRKNSWMAIRSAVTWHQKSLGHSDAVKRIQDTQWPRNLPNRPPSGRPKKVTESDMKKIETELDKRLDNPNDHGIEGLYAAFILAQELGCRPNEMHGINMMDDGRIFVPGSKFWSDDDRGLDRYICVSQKSREAIKIAIDIIRAEPGYRKNPKQLIEAIQARWSRMTAKIFPRRKRGRPTLYSFRHQLGADLRSDVQAKRRSRKEAAYIMGHQGTKSILDYSDPRSRRDRSMIKPGVSEAEVDSKVRNTHVHEQDFVVEYGKDETTMKQVEGEDLLAVADDPLAAGPSV